MAEISPINVLQEWLEGYLNFEKLPQKNIFWLTTMEFLCRRFNNPEQCAPAFHVAGSKGKGSISTMIASILEEAGYSTGLYTSPHILDFSERIGSGHGRFTDPIYERALKKLMSGIDSIIPEELPGSRPVTWFELVTLYSFLCFREAHVEQAVYEVGLGGRLDATNVIHPNVCCIGPIELEHTEYLGDTVEKIAAEKGGIIKNGVPVIIAPQKRSVKAVFEKIAAEKQAPVTFIDEALTSISSRFLCSENTTDTCGMNIELKSPFFSRPVTTTLRLLGEFQAQNAAMASIAVKTIFPDMPETIIEQGLAKAVLPGRFEICTHSAKYPRIPALVLDGAHTVNSIQVTMDTFRMLFEKKGTGTHLLFACAADKDVKDIAPLFKNHFTSVILTRPGSVKQSDIPSVTKAFSEAGIAFNCIEDYVKAIQTALETADIKKEPLLITGSFYLVAEVKKLLNQQ
jgi:dihydrofolate synthase / folylpolyglutamate synthase